MKDRRVLVACALRLAAGGGCRRSSDPSLTATTMDRFRGQGLSTRRQRRRSSALFLGLRKWSTGWWGQLVLTLHSLSRRRVEPRTAEPPRRRQALVVPPCRVRARNAPAHHHSQFCRKTSLPVDTVPSRRFEPLVPRSGLGTPSAGGHAGLSPPGGTPGAPSAMPCRLREPDLWSPCGR